MVIFTKKLEIKGKKKKKAKKKKKLVWDRIGMPVRFFSKLRVGFCALKHIKMVVSSESAFSISNMPSLSSASLFISFVLLS